MADLRNVDIDVHFSSPRLSGVNKNMSDFIEMWRLILTHRNSEIFIHTGDLPEITKPKVYRHIDDGCYLRLNQNGGIPYYETLCKYRNQVSVNIFFHKRSAIISLFHDYRRMKGV